MTSNPIHSVLPSERWSLHSSSLATITTILPDPDPRLREHYRALLEGIANAPEREIIPSIVAIRHVDPGFQGLVTCSRLAYRSWIAVQTIKRELQGTNFWSHNMYGVAEQIRRIEFAAALGTTAVETTLAETHPGFQWLWTEHSARRMPYARLRELMAEFPGYLVEDYPQPNPAAPAPPPAEDHPQPPTHVDPSVLQQPQTGVAQPVPHGVATNPIEMLAEAALHMVNNPEAPAIASPTTSRPATSGRVGRRTSPLLAPGSSSSSAHSPTLAASDVNQPMRRHRTSRQTAIPSPSTRARLREIRRAQREAADLRPLPEAEGRTLQFPVNDRSPASANKENEEGNDNMETEE